MEGSVEKGFVGFVGVVGSEMGVMVGSA